jgi:hypothetical protein
MLQDATITDDSPAPSAAAHGGRRVDEARLRQALAARFGPSPKHGGGWANSTHASEHMAAVLQMRINAARDPSVYMPDRAVRALIVSVILSEVQATARGYSVGKTLPDGDLRNAAYWSKEIYPDLDVPIRELVNRLDRYARALDKGGFAIQKTGH